MNAALTSNKNENRFHSFLLILGMAAILSLIGWLLFGKIGLVTAVILTALNALFGPSVSARLVLRMYKAQPITAQVSPGLTQLFQELCRRAKLDPLPGFYYIPTQMPNAFAVGVGKTSAVAITDGLIRAMTPRELAGVIAHEVAHLRHHDTRVMGLADAMGRMTSMLARIGFFLVLFSGASLLFGGSGWMVAVCGVIMFVTPTVVALMQLALSRSREFNADMGAAELTGDPMGLASALQKLDPNSSKSIFRQAIDPQQMQQPAFLRTHPPTEERVRELMEVAEIDPARIDSLVDKVQENRAVDRRGEPVVYIGYPKVRQKQRYRVRSGHYR